MGIEWPSRCAGHEAYESSSDEGRLWHYEKEKKCIGIRSTEKYRECVNNCNEGQKEYNLEKRDDSRPSAIAEHKKWVWGYTGTAV